MESLISFDDTEIGRDIIINNAQTEDTVTADQACRESEAAANAILKELQLDLEEDEVAEPVMDEGSDIRHEAQLVEMIDGTTESDSEEIGGRVAAREQERDEDILDGPNAVKHRRNYTINFKIRALQLLARNNNSVSKTAKELGMSRKNLQRWRKDVENLQEANASRSFRSRTRRRKQRNQSGRLPQLEVELLNWVREQRRNDLPVHAKDIREQALKIHADSEQEGRFDASKGWVFRFMNRHNLVRRSVTSIGQKFPGNSQQLATTFLQELQAVYRDTPVHGIANMDEVPMYFDMPHSKTIDMKGLHTIRVRTTGNEHLRFTVVLTMMGNGAKLQPMIIFKGLKRKPNEEFPPGIHIAVSKGGSMSGHLLNTEYLPHIWNRRAGGIFNTPGVLVWDQHASHKDETDVATMRGRYRTEVRYIPPGMTSILQPLDVAINKTFKGNLRSKWEKWISEGEVVLTRGGRRKRASYSLVARWVVESWREVERDTIMKAFTCCGFQDGVTHDQLNKRLCSLIRDGQIPEPAEVVEITTSDEEDANNSNTDSDTD